MIFRIEELAFRMPTLVVGPFVNSASYLPLQVGAAIRNIASNAEIFEADIPSELTLVGERIRSAHPDAHLRFSGFWRDLCCLEVAEGTVAAGAPPNFTLDRSLSRCCPPTAALRRHHLTVAN